MANNSSDPRTINRHSNIRDYGITVEEYDYLLAKQKNRCAICERRFEDVGVGKVSSPTIDHDHDSEWVRGLLCHYCNVALGFFDDDLQRMEKAIQYLVSTATPTGWSFSEAREECKKSTRKNMARKMSPESMEKRRATMRQTWANPEKKAHQATQMAKRWEDPQYRERMTQMAKERASTAEGKAHLVRASHAAQSKKERIIGK